MWVRQQRLTSRKLRRCHALFLSAAGLRIGEWQATWRSHCEGSRHAWAAVVAASSSNRGGSSDATCHVQNNTHSVRDAGVFVVTFALAVAEGSARNRTGSSTRRTASSHSCSHCRCGRPRRRTGGGSGSGRRVVAVVVVVV